MSKYTITITENIPNPTPPLLRRLQGAPSHFESEILTLDTDKDLTAEIAQLIKQTKESK